MATYQAFTPNRILLQLMDTVKNKEEPVTVKELRRGIVFQPQAVREVFEPLLAGDERGIAVCQPDRNKKLQQGIATTTLSIPWGNHLHHLNNEGGSITQEILRIRDLQHTIADTPIPIPLTGDTAVQFAMHDWRIYGTPNSTHIPTGGPGTYPYPTPAPNPPHTFQDADPNSKVRVYVLDTVPTLRGGYTGDEKKAADWWGKLPKKSMNDLLKNASQLTDFEKPPYIPVNDARNANAIALNVANHGLFVAQLIHREAPTVPIHMVQIMNNYNVGSVIGFHAAINHLSGEIGSWLAQDNQRRVIVNMSFSYNVPLEQYTIAQSIDRMLADGMISKKEKDDLLAEARAVSQEADGLPAGYWELFVESQTQLVSSTLADPRVMILAAVGNDSFHTVPPSKVPARLPARLQGIHGVDAINAVFSNAADANQGEGLSKKGGTGAKISNHAGDQRVIPDRGDNTNLWVGFYPDGDFSDLKKTGAGEKVPESTQYVEWAGTSFATARATGQAAAAWLADPTQASENVRTLVANNFPQ